MQKADGERATRLEVLLRVLEARADELEARGAAFGVANAQQIVDEAQRQQAALDFSGDTEGNLPWMV